MELDLHKLGTVYLIHFHAPGNPETVATVNRWGSLGASHYLGFSEDLGKRLASHRQGKGAKLIKELLAQGLDFSLVRIWERETIAFEQRLKSGRRGKSLCPICSGCRAYGRGTK